MHVPVGFTDVHSHIIEYMKLFSSKGTILFSESQQMSFNFINLYLIFHFSAEMSNSNIIFLSSLIPPIFSLINIILIYIIINKLHSHRIGLLAMLLFGWENQILIFGHEMRTQTLGVLILYLILFFQYSDMKKSVSTSIVLIILFFNAATAAFSTFIYTFLLIFVLLLLYVLLPRFSIFEYKPPLLTIRIFLLFIIFFIFYLYYISGGLQNIVLTFIQLFIQTLYQTDIGQLAIGKTGQLIYGNFVKLSTYLFWLIFLLSSIVYTIQIINKKNIAQATFFLSFGFLFAYMIFNSFFGVLSAGRIYSVVFVLMASVVSFAFIQIESETKSKLPNACIKFCIYLVILIFISSSIVKIPNYVIGNTSPIRSSEFIDYVPYWDSDFPQYASSKFISSFSVNQSLDVNVLVPNYYLGQIMASKKTLLPTKLILLQDKFRGNAAYSYREELPKSKTYDRINQIYYNGDYIIFTNNLD